MNTPKKYPNEDEQFFSIFQDVFYDGKESAPRGLKIKEIENYSYILEPFVRFSSFTERKLNIDYIKREFLWYLKGDKNDLSIIKHAKMWGNLVNPDGSINSNYGQYIFGDQDQFSRVVETLKADPDSRRAAIIILNKDHLASETKDYPCTYSMSFRIRDGFLNMTVRMRSQDAVFGMGNDAPCFSFVHEMMLNALREFYPDLKYGDYYHSADSFHVYEKHFKMLEQINRFALHVKVDCPKINGPDEVRFLRERNFAAIPPEFQFTQWLNTYEKE